MSKTCGIVTMENVKISGHPAATTPVNLSLLAALARIGSGDTNPGFEDCRVQVRNEAGAVHIFVNVFSADMFWQLPGDKLASRMAGGLKTMSKSWELVDKVTADDGRAVVLHTLYTYTGKFNQ